MPKIIKQIGVDLVGLPTISPLPRRLAMAYCAVVEELIRAKQRIAELEGREKAIVLKEMTREEAKQEIKQLFQSGQTLYYSDIVKELGIDLETVVEICNELIESGSVKVNA